ncbi:MAG: extracellular solute-binding protein [Marmoricola sp.]
MASEIQDNQRRPSGSSPLSRRTFLKGSLTAGAAAVAGPTLLSACGSSGSTTSKSLKAYKAADINWKKAAGTTVPVAVIPATYFSNMLEMLPQFEELTGITVKAEQVPPQKIRENVVRDLSTKTGRYFTHAADPMYYPLYVANDWVLPMEPFLSNQELCNPDWFALDDIFKIWRQADSIKGHLYGMPYDGEVTVQVYRTDLYDKAGLKPAQTMDEFRSNAARLNDPSKRIWGTALRGLPGAGQNMYIFPSLFIEWGASWFDSSGNPTVNSPQAVAALEYYVKLLNDDAPSAVVNWNWPDIAEAFARGTLASYIDAHSSAAVLTDPKQSTVIHDLGFGRWPKGPSGKRCTSIWNWGFPINGSISRKEQEATWLFIQWAASKETQIRTSYQYHGDSKRSGVNRDSIWRDPAYAKAVSAGRNFINAALTSLHDDTHIDWRPRVPQWPAIGDQMATLIQAALTKQMTPRQALDKGNQEIEKIMKTGS